MKNSSILLEHTYLVQKSQGTAISLAIAQRKIQNRLITAIKALYLQQPFSDAFLHTASILANYLLFAWQKPHELFWDASWRDCPERQASWELGGSAQRKPPSRGTKAPPMSRKPITQHTVNEQQQKSKCSRGNELLPVTQKVEEAATTVDWILPQQSVILKLFGQTGKTYFLLNKGLTICSSLPNKNSPATIQHAPKSKKK